MLDYGVGAMDRRERVTSGAVVFARAAPAVVARLRGGTKGRIFPRPHRDRSDARDNGMGKRSRRRRHRSGKVEASLDDPGDWVVIDGRRYFVAGYTPGGVPYGCFEDEFDESPQRDVEAPW